MKKKFGSKITIALLSLTLILGVLPGIAYGETGAASDGNNNIYTVNFGTGFFAVGDAQVQAKVEDGEGEYDTAERKVQLTENTPILLEGFNSETMEAWLRVVSDQDDFKTRLNVKDGQTSISQRQVQTMAYRDGIEYEFMVVVKPQNTDEEEVIKSSGKKTKGEPSNTNPNQRNNKAAAKIALDAGIKAISSGNKVTASWGAVKGASSYEIYANYCGKKTLKKIKTVSGKKTSFNITKLNGRRFNPTKNLQLFVVAYKTVKGKKVKLARSIKVYAPGSRNSRRTNVTGVKVKKASFTLKKGKKAKIKAKLILQKKNKKPLKYGAKFRYATSDAKVAKVSKKGRITAVGKGKCTVYVYAVSGVSKKIKVTVK